MYNYETMTASQRALYDERARSLGYKDFRDYCEEYNRRIAARKDEERRQLVEIKKRGHLVAFEHNGWQYWVFDGALYSVHSDGDPERVGIWCSLSRLAPHLARLHQVLGYRFFTENPDMSVVDRDFFAQFSTVA